MNRNEVEFESCETISGEVGLWLSVLISLLTDIQGPKHRAGYLEAKRIILHREGCFNIMADAFQLSPGELQKRIITSLERRGIHIT